MQGVSPKHLCRYGLSMHHSHIVLLNRTQEGELEELPKPSAEPEQKPTKPKTTKDTKESQSGWEAENKPETEVVKGKSGEGCK